jgi:hypothetical protein
MYRSEVLVFGASLRFKKCFLARLLLISVIFYSTSKVLPTMQLLLTSLTLSLSLLPFITAAGTCTSSGALSWPPVGDCSKTDKYGSIVQNCRACCLNDGNCFQTCAKTAGLRKRDTIGEQFFGAIREKRELTTRAIALSCVGLEGCYKYTDGSLLCLNLGTGMFEISRL